MNKLKNIFLIQSIINIFLQFADFYFTIETISKYNKNFEGNPFYSSIFDNCLIYNYDFFHCIVWLSITKIIGILPIILLCLYSKKGKAENILLFIINVYYFWHTVSWILFNYYGFNLNKFCF